VTTSQPSCAFCRIVAADDPDVLVYRSEHVAGFLDIRPVFHGHVLLVPREHHETLDAVPAALAEPLQAAVQTTMRALRSAVGAQGAFVASNNVVSQSVPHLHWHVVPRTRGDGLRGFFWPRHPYADDAELATVRLRVRDAIAEARRAVDQ
jgi:histidine triad (HIT) family protein